MWSKLLGFRNSQKKKPRKRSDAMIKLSFQETKVFRGLQEQKRLWSKMSNHEDETIASGQKKQRSANHHGFPSHVWKQRFSLLIIIVYNTILHHFLKRLSFNFGRYYKMCAMGRFLIDEKMNDFKNQAYVILIKIIHKNAFTVYTSGIISKGKYFQTCLEQQMTRFSVLSRSFVIFAVCHSFTQVRFSQGFALVPSSIALQVLPGKHRTMIVRQQSEQLNMR